jgi:hypothetical protein
MNDLPHPRDARLPARYIAAKTALAECASVDECKAWKEKMVALASYARQTNDTSLLDYATEIRNRARRRGGELLREVESKRGANQNIRDVTVPKVGRIAVATKAGLSERERKTMLRIAGMSEKEFERKVKDPSLGQPKVKPAPYRNEFLDWTHAVEHLATVPDCGLEVLAKRDPSCAPDLLAQADQALQNVKAWAAKLRKV